ncbi:MAG: arginase [Rhodocyclaceae bacterium]
MNSPAATLRLIGVASALGAPAAAHGAEAAVQSLREQGLLAALRRSGLDTAWRTIIEPPDGPRLPALGALLRELADEVAACIGAGTVPLVIGGDHSIAAGTWRGVGRALGRAPGLIWVDAHLDAHTLASSLSGNPHGMPLAALLGSGAAELTEIEGPVLDAQRLALVGARCCEAAERQLLARFGARVFAMTEIERRGFPAVWADAMRIAGHDDAPFGISIDLDAIDPGQAPGVATPVAGGIDGGALRQAIAGVLRERRCVALEISEYSPDRDPLGITGRLAIDLLASACAPAAG